ncbi:HD domain-containing protein [Brachybacterium sp. ACRRE]|uniref:HD domain-containing protein n=1 Tax=Brachybacterium sp. ACRRE TaxID=2918184 RepID=UPI001EF1D1EA|nr:HD domain-containing protein [Brachybacterium sp. ACRRE]MCG7310823.1 HD domain-containing protein [Brachybacterium sp. ACRRE]
MTEGHDVRGIDADTLGLDGRWFDPVWRLEVELTPLELELLDTWWVRRLAFVAHAGIASFTTTQSYSRIEHSLGVLALTAHFAPDDRAARATALLHDIGHLPFSHTLEGLGGLDHHTIGRERVAELDPVLRRHGVEAEEIIAIDEGERPSPLTNAYGALKLDHLDSFLRSGQVHGRTTTSPREMLGRMRLIDGAVDTDEQTADELVDLIVAEARHQRAPSNVVPIAVLKHLVTTALDAGASFDTADLAQMTDGELWAALLADPVTREVTRELRAHPRRWRMDTLPTDAPSDGSDTGALDVHIRRGYLALPTVDGAMITDPRITALDDALPLHLRVVRA